MHIRVVLYSNRLVVSPARFSARHTSLSFFFLSLSFAFFFDSYPDPISVRGQIRRRPLKIALPTDSRTLAINSRELRPL